MRYLKYLLVIVLAGGSLVVWHRVAASPAPVAPEVVPAVRVVYPRDADLEDRLVLRGFIEADETITIIPLVGGAILDLPVRVGDEVQRDAVVVRIDPARYELLLGQAEASYSAARSTWDRTRRLYEAQATSVQNYDGARAQYDAARAQRDQAQLQLEYATVRAPRDGVVLMRHLSAGDMASPERPVLTIGDLSRLVVRTAVPEQRYRQFAESPESVEIRVSRGDEVARATVRTVAPTVHPATRTFDVTADIAPRQAVLRPGMTVLVTFIFATDRSVPVVPQEALGYRNSLW